MADEPLFCDQQVTQENELIADDLVLVTIIVAEVIQLFDRRHNERASDIIERHYSVQPAADGLPSGYLTDDDDYTSIETSGRSRGLAGASAWARV